MCEKRSHWTQEHLCVRLLINIIIPIFLIAKIWWSTKLYIYWLILIALYTNSFGLMHVFLWSCIIIIFWFSLPNYNDYIFCSFLCSTGKQQGSKVLYFIFLMSTAALYSFIKKFWSSSCATTNVSHILIPHAVNAAVLAFLFILHCNYFECWIATAPSHYLLFFLQVQWFHSLYCCGWFLDCAMRINLSL